MIKQLLYVCIMLAVVTGCARASRNPPGELIFTVYHYRMPGAGEGVQLCYVISKNHGEKEFLYDDIENFVYEWGYNYTISVEKRVIKSPASDAAAVRYRLVKIVSKEKVLPAVEFDLPVVFNDQVIVQNDHGTCSYFGEVNIQPASFSCAGLARAKSATFRHLGDGKGLQLVKLK